MSSIRVRMLTEEALSYMKNNLETVTKLIQNNKRNDWMYSYFPQPMFVEKKYVIDDFELEDNPNSKDFEIDVLNHITLYEALKSLPRHIITNERFWLWLYLDKFYSQTRSMMAIKSKSTISDHWMFKQGKRRGLFFGVLSRMYFRVDLTVSEDEEDKYELTRWVIEEPERFRNLTWRSFSSERELVHGIVKGEKRAVEEVGVEVLKIYTAVAKYVSLLGSARLLDVFSEKDIESLVYDKCKELLVESKGE